MTRRGCRQKIRGLAVILLVLTCPLVSAQTWTAEAGGQVMVEFDASASDAAVEALEVLRDRGYHFARVDSVVAPVVHVTTGPLVRFGGIVIESDSLPVGRYEAVLSVREGDPAQTSRLADDVRGLVDLARSEGFADPSVTLGVEPPLGETLPVSFRIREGERLALSRVVLRGARRSTGRFALLASGLDAGRPLVGFDPERVRRSILDTGAFESVGSPELVLDAEGELVVEVPVVEGPPGAVDAVVGYLPPSDTRGGDVVGTARVDLASPFGGGRTLRLALDRNPGLASRLSAYGSDPFVFGLPLRAALGFEGEGRDSTYSRQRVGAEVGIRVAPGLLVSVTGSRESVQPGRAGARVGESGAPRVRRSSALFGGLAVRYSSLDSRRGPSRGLLLATGFEQGVRTRDALDSVAVPTRLSQQRLDATTRVFVPLVGRVVGVLGADARVLLTEKGATTDATRYDEGELFRFGGASSLRGYDEEAFVGNAVGRALAEVRAGLGGEAFAFAFGDLGVVRRPVLDEEAAETRVLPGYGVGAQLETGLGLVALTYALNPDLPASRGKVHLRLQLGL